ncbi:MAG: hypothetical protein JF600_06320 [Xanthomonadales bacterium]|nr:hypothetical protein [Xanthomonadales bacterium]
MRIQLSLVLLAAATFCAPAFAEDATRLSVTPDQIRTQQAELRHAIETKSGNYAQYSDEERKAILARQDDVLTVLGDKTSIDDLGPEGKVRLTNALEAVDAAVNRAEDNRMICEIVKRTGSNRSERKCMTVGQRRQMRERMESRGISTSR